MAIIQAMDTVPALCCTCRFGTMIPAVVAAARTSVFWCRQGVPRVADRSSCPCYARGSPLEAAAEPRPRLRTAPSNIEKPVAGSRESEGPEDPPRGWESTLTPSA
jgi:hypothetical protein